MIDPGSPAAMLGHYRTPREHNDGDKPTRLTLLTLIVWADDNLFVERSAADTKAALFDRGKLESIDGVSQWLPIE